MRQYLEVAANLLAANGHEPQFYEGVYADRMIAANTDQVGVFIAGHLNAGHGSYGLIKLDYRAGRRTVDLAFGLCEIWNNGLPAQDAAGNPSNQVWLLDPWGPDFRLFPTGARVEFKTQEDRGYNNISDVHAPALLLEPLFLDNPHHVEWLIADGIQIIGQTIATAIHSWSGD